jgi:hypothetical protein
MPKYDKWTTTDPVAINNEVILMRKMGKSEEEIDDFKKRLRKVPKPD